MKHACYSLLCALLLFSITAHANRIVPAAKPYYQPTASIYPSPATHFVQFFSSQNPIKAEGMKNTLELQGYPAFVNVEQAHQHPYYQVHIGPFSSRDLAQQAKQQVIKQYPQHSFLTAAILKTSL